MIIKANPIKEILNPGENKFAGIMDAKGLTLFWHPCIDKGQGHWTPDFYCLEENIFYEVHYDKSGYFVKEDIYSSLIKKGWPLRIVDPEGHPFMYRKGIPVPQGA